MFYEDLTLGVYDQRSAAALPQTSRNQSEIATSNTTEEVGSIGNSNEAANSSNTFNRSVPGELFFASSLSSAGASSSPPPVPRRTPQLRRIGQTHRSSQRLAANSRSSSGCLLESSTVNTSGLLPRHSPRSACIRHPFIPQVISSRENLSRQNQSASGNIITNEFSNDDGIQLISTERVTRSQRRAAERLLATNSRTSHNRHSQNIQDRSTIRAALAAERAQCRESDDDCVICLCKKSNRSVILPCMHTFCFDCIYRWLCINPSCPLCKCLAHKIIYSIISDTEYTEILVSDLHSDNEFNGVNNLPTEIGVDEEYIRPPAQDDSVPQSHRYQYHQLGTHLLNYWSNFTRSPVDRTLPPLPPLIPGTSIPDSSSLMPQTSNSSVPDNEFNGVNNLPTAEDGSVPQSHRYQHHQLGTHPLNNLNNVTRSPVDRTLPPLPPLIPGTSIPDSSSLMPQTSNSSVPDNEFNGVNNLPTAEDGSVPQSHRYQYDPVRYHLLRYWSNLTRSLFGRTLPPLPPLIPGTSIPDSSSLMPQTSNSSVPDNEFNGVNNLPTAEDGSVPQSHRSQHHQLGTYPLNNLNNVTRSPVDRTLPPLPPLIPGTSIPDSSSLMPQTSNSSVPNNENSVTFLIALVSRAIRLGSSVIIDGLLLRQLVYVFHLHSVPERRPEYVQDIRPEFLAANETHRHRLAWFIRRELRVLAPWLAYDVSHSLQSNSEHAAVTTPLIYGTPGLEVETRELDALTNLVLQHICIVPITNQQAIVDLLRSQPALHSSLVPTGYLRHFASEILQFAQFTGTIGEYDSSVSLYQRRIIQSGLAALSNERNQDMHSRRLSFDPHLVVYIASSSRVHPRTGFIQPRGFIYPLANWLLQRLFVHAVCDLHPDIIAGTGNPPNSPNIVYCSGPLLGCHSYCCRITGTSYSLLQTIVSSFTSRNQVSGQTRNISPDGTVNTPRISSSQLLYQRILSEFIDHARFSEAQSKHFSLYNNRFPLVPVTSQSSEGDPPISVSTDRIDATNSVRNVINPTESPAYLRPALLSYPLALRRLDGLQHLFSERVPGLSNDRERMVSELLHIPLWSLTNTPSTVIDLTNSTTVVSGSQTTLTRSESQPQSLQSVNTTRAPYTSRLSVTDRGLLSEPALLPNTQADPSSISSSITNVVCSDINSVNWNSAVSNQPTSTNTLCFQDSRSSPLSTLANETISIQNSSSGCPETAQYLYISSGSSDEEVTVYHKDTGTAVELIDTTSDESEDDNNSFRNELRNTCGCEEYHCSSHTTEPSISLQSDVPLTNMYASTSAQTTQNNTARQSVVTSNNSVDSIVNTTKEVSVNLSLSCTRSSSSNCTDSITNQQPSITAHEESMEIDEAVFPSSSKDWITSMTNSSGKYKGTVTDSSNAIQSLSSEHTRTILSPRNSLKHYYPSQTKRPSYYHHRKRKLDFNLNHSESTDSDCELVGESIRIYDDSSCSVSGTSSSSSDDCQSATRFSPTLIHCCSPSKCKSSHKKHLHYPRSFTCHHKRSCCCHYQSKHRKKTFVQIPDILIYLNNPSSPVIISDNDDSTESHKVVGENRIDSIHANQHIYSENQETVVSQLPHVSVINAGTSLSFSAETGRSALPNHCQNHYVSSHQTCNINSGSQPYVQNSSHSSTSCRILQPDTVEDFYRVIAKHERQSQGSTHVASTVDEATVPSSSCHKSNQTDNINLPSSSASRSPSCGTQE
ncbi:unnamed protein product [Trichobilharzia szidati]|nr:unnamed protein product [Trichobilharzia szidati]